MPKLILSMDGLVLKEIKLDKERTTIGRKSTNDVQIDNMAISSEHAVITTILQDAFLEDLNSTNGTNINGHSIKKCVLKDNDAIDLGKYRIKFLADTPQALEETLDPSEMIDSAVLAPIIKQELVAAEMGEASVQSLRSTGLLPPEVTLKRGVIQILNGASAGLLLELSKPLNTLGKTGEQVVVLAKRPQGYFLTQIEGQDVVLLNGEPVGATAHALQDHDVIEVAGVKMEFFLRR